ncbi:MAG: hypothetical protein AAGU05_03710 [Anaerolineaceae bacterium]
MQKYVAQEPRHVHGTPELFESGQNFIKKLSTEEKVLAICSHCKGEMGFAWPHPGILRWMKLCRKLLNFIHGREKHEGKQIDTRKSFSTCFHRR